LQAAQGGTHGIGVGALGLFDRGLVGEEHAVAVGAVQVGRGLVGGGELGDELLVLGRGDAGGVADAGDEAIGCLADGCQVLAGDGSVRGMAEDISADLLQAMVSRSGGELVSAP
jgi:hypothetical protein